MANDYLRITIVSNFRPRDLLDIAKEAAIEAGFGLGENGRGSVVACRQLYQQTYFLRTLIAEAEIEVYADKTADGDGRLTLDCRLFRRGILGGSKARKWAEAFADTVEDFIRDDGGKIYSSRES